MGLQPLDLPVDSYLEEHISLPVPVGGKEKDDSVLSGYLEQIDIDHLFIR